MVKGMYSTPSASRNITINLIYSNEDQQHLSITYPQINEIDSNTLLVVLGYRSNWSATLTPSTKSTFRVSCYSTQFTITLDINAFEGEKVVVVQTLYANPDTNFGWRRAYDCKTDMVNDVRTLPNVCMQFSYNAIYRMILPEDDFELAVRSIMMTEARTYVVW